MITAVNDVFWVCLIAFGIAFIVFGIDDFCLDIFYWLLRIYRKIRFGKRETLTYKKLSAIPEKKIAVLVPCWKESHVIAKMLQHNLVYMDYENYDFYVGVYSNDQETIDAIAPLTRIFSNLFYVISDKPGPTGKAYNLNSIYQFIKRKEKEANLKYDIFVMHDAEDVIHPYEFKLFNYLMPKKDIIQLPVFPLAVKYRKWVHWVYNDEFSEVHTKDLVAREALKGFIPSAGVSTAFTHQAIEFLVNDIAADNISLPFSEKTVTEDYASAFLMQLHNKRMIFLFRKVRRIQFIKKWFRPRKLSLRVVREIIATRALFPREYAKAVKQRSRWMLGIVIQHWIHYGWKGNFIYRYFIYKDRKSILTVFLSFLGLFVFIYWLGVYIIDQYHHEPINTLQHYLVNFPYMKIILIITLGLMANRILQRAIAVCRVYGFLPALMSPPRILLSNLINAHAGFKAVIQALSKPKAVKASVKEVVPEWQKTKNTFPSKTLIFHHMFKLGDYLLENELISERNLIQALLIQEKTKERLGAILVKQSMISQDTLLRVLGKLYHLPVMPMASKQVLVSTDLPEISESTYDWMIDRSICPIQRNDNIVTLAFSDPEDRIALVESTEILRVFRLKCVLGRVSINDAP